MASSQEEEITPTARLAAPGTEVLFVDGKLDSESSTLQWVRVGGSRTLLVPQPSLTDPNDPLRWSTAKKCGVFLNGLGYAFMGSVTGPIMAAGMLPLAETFNESLQRLTYANGATLICQGVGNIFWMPLAIKLGRRPVYMFSNILMGVACVWLGLASNASYIPFIIGRAFLGLFEAPIESIVPTTITDMFFLHDRGEKVSIYGLAILGGNELGPLFSALIIQQLGMAWAFYIVACFIGLNAVTMFFFMPETKYTERRPDVHLPVAADDEQSKQDTTRVEYVDAEVSAPASQPQKSFIQGLSLWPTPDPNVHLWKTFFRPFVLVTYPTVLWACLVYGLSLGWNVILGATVAQLYAVPYGFNWQAQGLVFLSPLVGSLVGTWLCGSLSDAIANYFTRENGGIREPEMRLPTCILGCLLIFFGALIVGLTYHYHTHWAGSVIGFGVLSAGAQMGVSLSMTYVLDCHKEASYSFLFFRQRMCSRIYQLSVEVMVVVASLKSVLAWIWTWVINDWIDLDGVLTVVMVIASINVVIFMTTIPMYIWGKSARIWIAERNMLGRCGLN